MLAKYFQNRVARVIAVLRVLLAVIFLVALVADPSQPNRHPAEGYALIGAYLVLALLLLRVAWVSWWFDFRLALPAHALDIAVFALSVWFTEEPGNTFNSPFIAFFFFLMFAATIRWDWRVTAWSALAAVLGYIVVGIALYWAGNDLEAQIFARRLSYMGVIGFAFVLLGVQFRTGRRENPPSDFLDEDPLEAAVRYAAAQLSAGKVGIWWEETDEPALIVLLREGFAAKKRLVQPGNRSPMIELFDVSTGRALVETPPGSRKVARTLSETSALAAEVSASEGLSTRLITAQGTLLELVVADMPSVAADDMARVYEIAREIAAMVEQRALARLERDRAVIRTRESLARDLHDSVAQSLAGATFGLEALRQTIPDDAAPARNLAEELKARLRSEQSHIREMIDRLRLASADEVTVSMAAELEDTVEECRTRWQVEIDCQELEEISVEAALAFECRQIFREAVSNAVRHGKARCISVSAKSCEGALRIEIANDGLPFGNLGSEVEPWTIRDRVGRLGGTMAIHDDPRWPRLVVELPLKRGRV